MKQLALTILVLLFPACLQRNFNTNVKVVNGDSNISPASQVYKSTVALKMKNGHCSGVIVGTNAILTAAHCYRGEKFLAAEMGIKREYSVPLKPTFHEHPTFKQRRTNAQGEERRYDIALLFLDGPLPEGFEPVKLPEGVSVTSGENILVAGYGATQNDPDSQEDWFLRQATLKFDQTDYLDEELFTAHSADPDGSSACGGDSGGAAYVKKNGEWLLLGHVLGANDTEGGPCGSQKNLFLYSHKYRSWFKEMGVKFQDD